jgi:hypothetical protein
MYRYPVKIKNKFLLEDCKGGGLTDKACTEYDDEQG